MQTLVQFKESKIYLRTTGLCPRFELSTYTYYAKGFGIFLFTTIVSWKTNQCKAAGSGNGTRSCRWQLSFILCLYCLQ